MTPRQKAAIDAGHPEWAELPRNRQRAVAMGVDHYFTGLPLICGHTPIRSVSFGINRCLICAGVERDDRSE